MKDEWNIGQEGHLEVCWSATSGISKVQVSLLLLADSRGGAEARALSPPAPLAQGEGREEESGRRAESGSGLVMSQPLRRRWLRAERILFTCTLFGYCSERWHDFKSRRWATSAELRGGFQRRRFHAEGGNEGR
jgi:hypothetical protein